MTEFTQALIAMGIVGTFSLAAGLISIKIAEGIVERAELEEEEDFVHDKDGNKIAYNEDDQE